MSEYELPDLYELQKQLKNELTKKRFQHTMGVMYTAASMAMSYGADVNQALYAGLLHDCAKCLSDEEKLKACHKYKIMISPTERENTQLLHAKIGAVYAKKIYGIQDEDILSSIRWHTTGKADMSLLEEIIFVADYIEPGRKELPNMARIRYLAFHNLTDCIVAIIENTLTYLEGKKSLIDNASRETYDFYKRKQENEHESI